jgi:hypothetical protein
MEIPGKGWFVLDTSALEEKVRPQTIHMARKTGHPTSFMTAPYNKRDSLSTP